MSQLQNICNYKRIIYKFERNDNGKLLIVKDESFYPYYYERSDEGKFDTYDGHKARKIIVTEPKEVAERRTGSSYEADILYPKRYIIDRIETFEKSPIKYFFIDIEILTKDFPNPDEAKEPISCITIYNALTQELKTWYLEDYATEEKMLQEFVIHIQDEKPDLLVGWNILDFDFPYLYNRILDFSKKISILLYKYGKSKNNKK